MASPTYSDSTIQIGGNSVGISIQKPVGGPGITAGTLILAVVYIENDIAVGAPDGTWTEYTPIPENNTASASFRYHFFWKRAVGSEVGGTYDFTWAGSFWTSGIAVAIEGEYSTGNPFDGVSVGITVANSATMPTVSLVTTTADTLLVWFASNFSGGAVTQPGGFTEREDANDNCALATLAEAAAGSTGSLSGSGPNTSHISILIAVASVEVSPAIPATVPPTFNAAGTLGAVATGNVTPGMPAGWAADDIHFLTVCTNQGNTFPAITGWTNMGQDQNSANLSTGWYWRRAQAGDSAPAFTIASGTALSTTNGLYARIYGWRYCHKFGTPFIDATVAGTPTTNTTPQTASVDSEQTNCTVVCFACVDDDNTWSSGMPPSNWVNSGPILSSATGADAMMDSISTPRPTAGNLAAVTMGTQSAADYWKTLTLVLKPYIPLRPVRRNEAVRRASLW